MKVFAYHSLIFSKIIKNYNELQGNYNKLGKNEE